MALYPWQLLTVALLAAVAAQRSLVSTASLGGKDNGSIRNDSNSLDGSEKFSTQSEDGNVQELQNLKHSLVNSKRVPITHVLEQVESETPSENKNTLSAAKLQIKMNIPAQELFQTIPKYIDHKSIEGHQSNSDSNIDINKYSTYSGVQYSPLDMAEYVFWTGDEKGVTMALEEFLQDGLMSREEAITFLQEIKLNLDYLQTHYTQQGLYSQDHTKDQANTIRKYNHFTKQQFTNEDENMERYDLNDMREDISKKNSINNDQEILQRLQTDETEAYKKLLEKLRVADFLYTEYSLEEVIYQLSKIMFKQSLQQGSSEAQTALQKFTNFLETEAGDGHISKALEKKVLDVLIAALTDTLTEHPELVSAARQGLGSGTLNSQDEHSFLQKLLQSNSLNKITIKSLLTTYRAQLNSQSNHLNKERLNNIPDLNIPTVGYGK